jgi:imidazolonepropionase
VPNVPIEPHQPQQPAPPTLVLGRVVVGPDPSGHALSVLDPGAVVVEAGRIAWIGARAALPARWSQPGACRVIEAPLVTAGLVDAHTHAAWVGSRHAEYVMKLRGEGYEAIAARGGGIVASMRAIEDSDVDAIAATLARRLARMASLGVTTVEVKSGYGLRAALERRQLAAIAQVAGRADLPRVVPTFLALHALPPEARTGAEARAAHVAAAIAMVPAIAREGLAAYVDAYVDRNAFTVEEARPLGDAAREAGLGVRLHIGQFADVGGAELAAALGAASGDHVENVSREGLDAMARAGVAATLLPLASFVLAQQAPNVAAMRSAGVRLVVASDANPGTAPSESLPLAMAFAARLYGLSTDEVVLGATAHAAQALGLPTRGRLAIGGPADLVAWDLPHEEALLQPWGVSRARLVLRDGHTIHAASGSAPEA